MESYCRDRPSIGEAIGWYAIVFLLLYYVGATIQQFAPRPGLVVTLWGLVFAPTLLVARYLKVDFVETFHLRRPSARAMVAATLLGVSGVVVVNALNGAVSDLLLPQSGAFAEQFAREMERFFPPPDSIADAVVLILLVAVSPAICEEVLFRGFLLSSLRDRVSPAVAASVTALVATLGILSAILFFLPLHIVANALRYPMLMYTAVPSHRIGQTIRNRLVDHMMPRSP